MLKNNFFSLIFSNQVLEAAKRLQLGRLRLEMLKFELARLRRGRGSPQVNPVASSKTSNFARPSYAGVSLSDIRIPLMWKRKVWGKSNKHKALVNLHFLLYRTI